MAQKVTPAKEVESFVEELFAGLDFTTSGAALSAPNLLWSIRASALELQSEYVADRDYLVVGAWTQQATCNVSTAAKYSGASESSTLGLRPNLVVLHNSSMIFWTNLEWKKGQKLYLDIAGNSCLTLILRPV